MATTTTPKRRLIPLTIVVERTGISPSTLQRWSRSGKIRGAVKPGSDWLIPENRIEELKRLDEARDFDAAEAKRLRLAAGVSEAEAARRLKTRPLQIARWESGQYKPQRPMAFRYRELMKEWAEQILASESEKEGARAT